MWWRRSMTWKIFQPTVFLGPPEWMPHARCSIRTCNKTIFMTPRLERSANWPSFSFDCIVLTGTWHLVRSYPIFGAKKSSRGHFWVTFYDWRSFYDVALNQVDYLQFKRKKIADSKKAIRKKSRWPPPQYDSDFSSWNVKRTGAPEAQLSA